MHLMRYTPIYWLDVVPIRVDSIARNCVNVVLEDVSKGHRLVFHMWAQSKEAMV